MDALFLNFFLDKKCNLNIIVPRDLGLPGTPEVLQWYMHALESACSLLRPA